MRNGRKGYLPAVLLAALLVQGCLANSSYQSARIVERGSDTGTIGAAMTLKEDKDDESLWTLDGRARFGIASGWDGSIGMSVVGNLQRGGGAGLVGGDIRRSIIRDRLTFTLPVSVVIGDFSFYTTRFQPGLIGTLPLSRNLDLNASVRRNIFVWAPEIKAYTYNFGLGITTVSGRWTFHPELAVYHNIDQDIMLTQIGIGLVRNLVEADMRPPGRADPLIR
jgi:hypothetical protein